MTIQINISGTTIYNVSNDVIIDSIELGKRADYSFEVGSFKMFTSQITKNIPPYSFCRITDNDFVPHDYLISSEATAYFTNGKWMHDCKLLSLEAIMECYILGAKTFSLADSANDANVCFKIKELINQSAGNNKFRLSNYTIAFLMSYKNEYTFPDGTSLYEAIKTLANKNNLRFSCDLNSFGQGENSYFWLNFEENATNDYTLIEPRLVSFKLMQDGNNYCKYLQCASADVVDRANPTTFRNLTVRATNGVAISEDTAEFVLPTRVEGITKFEINGEFGVYNMAIHCSGFTKQYVDDHQDPNQGQGITVAKTLYEWRTGNEWESIYWQELYNKWLKDLGMDNKYFVVEYDSNNNVWASPTTSSYTYSGARDMTDYIVEKNVLDSIDVADQPKYVVYESGGNTIFNLKATYKDTFWGWILGTARTGMFESITMYPYEDSFESRIEIQFTEPIIVNYDISYTFNNQTSVMDASVNVECVPITNPMLIDTKNTTPINEPSFKAMTRTYSMGDSNGLLVDFKALTNDIDKQNDTLGDVEAILELDADVYYYDSEEDEDVIYYPEPNHQITFDYKGTSFTFYISSMATRYTNNRKTYQLNLSRTPYKIADAIGVDYQFNPTWLPLENIIERALHYEVRTLYPASIVNSKTVLINLTINNKVYSLRPAILKRSDSTYILYAEAQDNVVLGMASEYHDANYYQIENVTYGDENASFVYMSVDIAYIDANLSVSSSRKLPNGITNLTTLNVVTDTKVYKDSREKLTFTIKVSGYEI